jgi:hypothetical protein
MAVVQGAKLIQAMARLIPAKSRPRSPGAGGPARRLVAASSATEEHPAAFNLQERIVATETAHGTRPRPGSPGPPGANDAEWVRGANNLRGRVCEIRRHTLRRSLRAFQLRRLPLPSRFFDPTRRHLVPLQTLCHIRGGTDNPLKRRGVTAGFCRKDELQAVQEIEPDPRARLSEIRSQRTAAVGARR